MAVSSELALASSMSTRPGDVDITRPRKLPIGIKMRSSWSSPNGELPFASRVPMTRNGELPTRIVRPTGSRSPKSLSATVCPITQTLDFTLSSASVHASPFAMRKRRTGK